MDVIENPFVRKKYFIDPVELLKDMDAGGFSLYSSWPNYGDTLGMQWIKAPIDKEEELRSSISFVEQSRLGHILGHKCFIPGITQELTKNLSLLLQYTDMLIDTCSSDTAMKAWACVDRVDDLVRDLAISVDEKNLNTAHEILGMTKSIFNYMKKNYVGELIEFCRKDKTFISTWGTPAHYAVFQSNSVIL